jgi:hypothetical protein
MYHRHQPALVRLLPVFCFAHAPPSYSAFQKSRLIRRHWESQAFPPLESGPCAFTPTVLQDLAMLRQAEHERAEVVCETSSTKEVSPWLQLTRWSSYLNGHHMPSIWRFAFVPKINLEALYCTSQHAQLLYRFRAVTPHANYLLHRRTEGLS